jgi:hypothetical protein
MHDAPLKLLRLHSADHSVALTPDLLTPLPLRASRALRDEQALFHLPRYPEGEQFHTHKFPATLATFLPFRVITKYIFIR